MPERMNFGKRAIEELQPPATGRLAVYDERTPGLQVVVTAKGAKTFYVYRRVGGRPQRVRLGSFPAMTPEQARNAAAKVNAAIAEGSDPAADRRAIRAAMTFGELWTHYLETHAKPRKRTWHEDQRHYDKHLKRWASRLVRDIDRSTVTTLHGTIGKDAPYEANRVLALVSSIFTHAIRHGYTGDNPAKGVRRFPEHSRERFLDAAELRAFFQALHDEPNRTARDFFLTALLTGARRGNIEAMRWDALDLDRGLWRIPGKESKSGAPLAIVLPEPAVALLRQRRETVNGSPWVFPSKTSASGHMTEPKSAWRRICKRAGLDDLRVHDLRRTLGSWLTAGGASLPMVGRALGHKSHQATAVYARLSLDPVRASVETAAAAMLTAAGVEIGGDDGDS